MKYVKSHELCIKYKNIARKIALMCKSKVYNRIALWASDAVMLKQ